mmetsp:Transcript_28389/g.60136  ORF Transcript_28389/g.60136 Transcript_28389/m.60136 type:complete len:670 (+) Transcript_28389:90-2099(+)|eukprot:CAMPEP_0172543280 /NCGR_PEP_ID=MMETSP1067-20121228/13713_1 /TAXON_ID=265564 ORGANISM="Thalassiosira punctigera, Strain Tpunct2005C2" /NCGR_SAMPLE_ID=MMETSP1067 /ASSEMBLY_ACC=CAM_ASM_000444 /LENGTH=669 /DNA_ID=CAMNT_0013329671 /DNA_START=87 /DNA_END=2099 /DNA_ORIENTATION=-
MNKAVGCGDGRTRPLGPSPSNQPKKRAKKLSSIARRALLALESDNGGSSSSSEDERNARDFQHQEHQERGLLSSSQTIGDPAIQSTIGLDDEVVTTDGKVKTIKLHNGPEDGQRADPTVSDGAEDGKGADPTGNATDEKKSSSWDQACKSHFHHEREGKSDSCLSEDARKRDELPGSNLNGKPPAAGEIVSRINNTSENVVGMITESDAAARGADDEPGDDSPATDKCIVRPHAPTSKYHDILSSFLSTPFDDKAMIYHHNSKEGIDLRRKNQLKTWVSSFEDYLPIIPQKKFIKNMQRKNRGARTKQGESLRNAINCDLMSSAAISSEVTSFLICEGQKLIDSGNNISLTLNQQQPSFQYPPAPPIQHPPTQQLPTQHLFSRNQQMPNYYGLTQQHQNSYYPTPILNSYNPRPQIHPGHQHTNVWKYPQPFAAAAAVFPLVPGTNAYNNLALASSALGRQPIRDGIIPLQHSKDAVQTQTNIPKPKPKVVKARAEIKLTDSKRTDFLAKLPVSFGFRLDDDGVSQSLAQAAMQKWATDGRRAARLESFNQGTPKGDLGLKRKIGDVARSTGYGTPPDESQRMKTRNAAQPFELAGPDLPHGWTTRTFERTTSTPGRTTTYKQFYSPVIKAKFRSMRSALIFTKILKEPGISADEIKAYDVFKSRGHKL